MKHIVEFKYLLVLLILIYVNKSFTFEWTEDQIHSLETCAKEQGLNSVKEFFALAQSKDYKVHCVEACVLRHLGVIKNNGQFDLEKADLLIKDFVHDKKIEDELASISKACYEKIHEKEFDNDCDLAKALHECKVAKK